MRNRFPPRKWLFPAFLILGLATAPCLAQYGDFKSPQIGGGAAAPRRPAKAKPQPNKDEWSVARPSSTTKTQPPTKAREPVSKPNRGGHRSWNDYQPSTYSNRPPVYPGRDKPLPQPGVDYQPNSNPYGYGYGYRYYNNYRYNPGPNAQNRPRQGNSR